MRSVDKARKHGRRWIWLRWLSAAAGAVLVALGWVASDIATFASRSDAVSADAAVVLGAATAHGEPLPVYRGRIDHAVALYRAGRVKKLIVTGGVGAGSAEADSVAAKRYAVRHGVPAADVLTEETSRSTHQNLEYAGAIARRHDLHSLIIVSDPLHMRRAMAMASSLHLAAFSSPTPSSAVRSLPSQAVMLVRETFFLLDFRARQLFHAAN